MAAGLLFLMAGGGSGGHVIPALAVAAELVKRGHEIMFVGTRTGMEARLAPEAGYRIEWIEIGGLKRVGWRQTLKTGWQLPLAAARVWRMLGRLRPAAVFSMGGYVAGPVVVAAWMRGIPVVAMEPNAMPGFTNRVAARLCRRVLLGLPEAAKHFREGQTEVIGYPVREAFFRVPPKARGAELVVLITGGSQGSRTLNQAFRESWPLFRDAGLAVRFVHQCGRAAEAELQQAFASSGLNGVVTAFLQDMPAAFAEADVVVCRSGAGTVAELAAAGRPSLLIPFPFAADDHQLRNAEAMSAAGAARLVTDREMTGQRLFAEVSALAEDASALVRMGDAARRLGRQGTAARAAEILIECAAGRC